MLSIKKFWQFFFFWFFLPLFTLFITSPSLIIGFITRQYWWVAFTQRCWGNLIFWGGLQSYTAEGTQYLNTKKPYLIIANHSSAGDIAILAALVKTPVSWVIKDSLLKVPLLKYAFLLGLGIPIPRANARASQSRMMKKIHIVLRRSKASIIIFPEGTRSPDGVIREFKRGFVRIMKTYKLDILPVTLSGFHQFLPARKIFTNPKALIDIQIHEPIPFNSFKDKDERLIAEEMRLLISSKLKILPLI